MAESLTASQPTGPVDTQGSPIFTVAGSSETYSIPRHPTTADIAKRPVVVLVHGTDGMSGESGVQIRKFAEELAGRGFLALTPHYFDKDDGADTLPLLDLFQLRGATNIGRYPARIAAAVQHALGEPDAEAGRLGLVGFSLGGGLVLAYAESAPAGQVQAVIDFFGFIPDQQITTNAGKLPPTLVLHNNADAVVPVEHSKKLVAALEANGVTHDKVFYNDFNPERGNHPFLPGGLADTDSRSRSIAWLDTHLKSSS